jgi:hypothetical protein
MSKPKMTEKDRLVRAIALCTMCPDESFEQAVKHVYKNLNLAAMQNRKTPLEILRDMWKQLLTGTPWRRTNEMIANGYMRPLTIDEFEAHKEVLRTFQRRARHYDRTLAEAKEKGIIK